MSAPRVVLDDLCKRLKEGRITKRELTEHLNLLSPETLIDLIVEAEGTAHFNCLRGYDRVMLRNHLHAVIIERTKNK